MKKRRREKIKEAKFKGKSGRRKDNKKKATEVYKKVKGKELYTMLSGRQKKQIVKEYIY
jgi:hypothetical protein